MLGLGEVEGKGEGGRSGAQNLHRQQENEHIPFSPICTRELGEQVSSCLLLCELAGTSTGKNLQSRRNKR